MIAIVILNWNGAQMLQRFLPSVIENNTDVGEIFVADNGSTDNSLALLQERFPEVHVMTLEKNLGFAEGYNEAFRILEQKMPGQYDYYLLLNSDVRTTPNWLTPLYIYMEQHPEAAAAQPKILAEWANDTFEYAGACGGFIDRYGYPFCRGRMLNIVEKDLGQYDDVCPIFWASGAALLIRRKDWWEAGGLDGRFFDHQEEIDLCWRLRARGREVVCIPQSVVYHVGGGTLPQEHPRKTYLNFRNNLTMLYKNLPREEFHHVMKIRYWLDGVAILKYIFSLKWRNAWAAYRARRDFKTWRRIFDADRHLNMKKMVQQHPLGRTQNSMIAAFYIKGRKTFQQFMS